MLLSTVFSLLTGAVASPLDPRAGGASGTIPSTAAGLSVLCAALPTTDPNYTKACVKTSASVLKPTTSLSSSAAGKPKSSATAVKASVLPSTPKSTGLSNEAICALEAGNGDAKQDADTWTKSGAEVFFNNFIDQGTKDWSNRFFKAVINGGKQGISTFNCVQFLQPGSCPTPGGTACNTQYSPASAFLVHEAVRKRFLSITPFILYNI